MKKRSPDLRPRGISPSGEIPKACRDEIPRLVTNAVKTR